MTYNKPEIQVVGRATDVIESLNAKNSVPSDGPADLNRSIAAYDLDE